MFSYFVVNFQITYAWVCRELTHKYQLGCGTALPSLAIFQWLLAKAPSEMKSLDFALADYNPTVLQLVTLPNLLLSWAQVTRKESWEKEGELEIDAEVIQEFLNALKAHSITLSFFSGQWSSKFVELVCQNMPPSQPSKLTIIGAETIYSPAALASFADTLMSLLKHLGCTESTALIAAKKVYFGVGGSMEDFCNIVRTQGANVQQIREESDGVRRAVVEIKF